MTIASTNPATGETFATFESLGPTQVERGSGAPACRTGLAAPSPVTTSLT